MTIKLLTEHYLEFLSLKGDYTSSSESTLAKYYIVGNHMSRLKSKPLTLTLSKAVTYIKLYVNKLRWRWVISTYRNSTLKACNMSSILAISSSSNGSLSFNVYLKSFIVSIPDLRLLLYNCNLAYSAFFYVKPA